MNLPPLYKYLNISGAKLTLENKTFKHTKPSEFNDTVELTITSIFKEDIETSLENISKNFVQLILNNLNVEPVCDSPIKEQIQLIQNIFKSNPNASSIIQDKFLNPNKPIYDIEYYRELSNSYISEINNFMQSYRILCVTTLKDSEHMWNEYAEGHKGVALRIKPSTTKNSDKFQLFQPVQYQSQRPPLFEDPMEFISSFLFGDKESRTREAIESIIYTKTLEWQNESEYRLAIPILGDEEPWNTLPYHAGEITELHLGCEIFEEDARNIITMARSVNPKILVFQTERDKSGSLFSIPLRSDKIK